MKIIEVGTGFEEIPPKGAGGVENVIYSLSKEFAKLGHEVHIIDYQIPKNIPKGIHYHKVNMPNYPNKGFGHFLRGITFGIHSFILLKKITKEIHPDVIHINNQYNGGLICLRKNEFNAPIVFTVHNATWNYPMLPKLAKLRHFLDVVCIKKSDLIISVSNASKEKLAKHFQSISKKTRVIPNGTSIPKYKKIKTKKPVILCVARIAPYKNQLTLVKAAKEIPEAQFIFVGPIDNEEYYKKVKTAAGKNVTFAGVISRNELELWYKKTSIFVLPSLTEAGVPLATTDAMSYGLPIISSDIKPHKPIKLDNAGILIKPTAVKEYVKVIKHLLRNNNIRNNLGKNSLEEAKSKFSWGVIAKQMTIAFEELSQAYKHNSN